MKKRIKHPITAIVTGAAKGIGMAVAKRLAGEGCFVCIVDTDRDAGRRVASSIGKQSEFLQADITNELAVSDLFEKTTRRHGRIDILVNNAGIVRDKMIWNMSEADFDAVMNVNLKGTWLMCRAAARRMREQKYGRIVNIASRAWLGNAGQSNYAPSKAGVVALTRVLALELAKYNVTVNSVAPGLIDTPMTRGLGKAVLERLIAAQPTRKMGTPEDVAHAVWFLVAEENRFITGQTLYVDGGKSIGAGI